MTAPKPVRVDDHWGDVGTVETGEAYRMSTSPVAVVQVRARDHAGDPLDFTPAQAREFASAILAAADAIDPDGARPLAVVDSDGDVWRYSPNEGVYEFDGMRYSLDRIREDYGPLTEVSA